MNVLLLGVTGLVGNELLALLLQDEKVNSIHVLGRNRPGVDHEKVIFHQADLEKMQSLPEIGADVLFVAFGTTLKIAGSKERQELIDVDIPTKVMQLAFAQGTKRCSLVSAVGVSERSPFFYSRMKARLDRHARETGFEHLVLVKPSVLDGDRKEKRAGEKLSIAIGNWIGKTGLLNAYRPVKAKDVAASMIYRIGTDQVGVEEIANAEIPIEAKKYYATLDR